MSDILKPPLGDRYNAKKARWDLLAWGALSELVNVFTYGSYKYADNNWRKGLSFTNTLASLDRHLVAWRLGETRDPESGCHHLAHVMWNALVLIEFELLGRKDLDDRRLDCAPISPTSNIKDPPPKPIEVSPIAVAVNPDPLRPF